VVKTSAAAAPVVLIVVVLSLTGCPSLAMAYVAEGVRRGVGWSWFGGARVCGGDGRGRCPGGRGASGAGIGAVCVGRPGFRDAFFGGL